MRSFRLTLSLLILAACGKADISEQIEDRIPAGKLDGQPWIFAKATARNSAGTLSIHMFGEDEPDCATAPSSPDAGYILFGMPPTVGVRQLHFSFDFSDPANQTVTFYTPPSSNTIAVDGVLNLKELTATSMTLGIVARAGDSDNVNGVFSTPLCP